MGRCVEMTANPEHEATLQKLEQAGLFDPEELCNALAYFMRKDASNVPLKMNNRETVVSLLENAADSLDRAALDYYVSTK
jgi:hypothetical protein